MISVASLLTAMMAVQGAAGLPSSIRSDIEAATRVVADIPAAHGVNGLSGRPASAETASDSIASVPPVATPPPPPPPPPPSAPDVFGSSAAAEKLSLRDQRWIRIGALPSRNPLLSGLVQGAANLSRSQQASLVQSRVNRRLAYKQDRDNWGVSDYWASADETIARGAGDCEDHALVKLQALRLLGWDERDLYLMVGKKLSGEEHALLLVNIDGTFWVLEDGSDRIVHAGTFRTFVPLESYGAGWKWTHQVQTSASTRQHGLGGNTPGPFP